jgi:hypothetical protein
MDNGVDPKRGDERAHARLISNIADDERRARRHRPVEAGGQIIEHHGLLSGFEEGVNHVAADVAGAARDQDCHGSELIDDSDNRAIQLLIAAS